MHRRGVGIASLAPAESWLHPLGAHPTEVEQMMGEIILRVMAWPAQPVTMKNGRAAAQATCVVCGTRKFRIGAIRQQ